MSSSRIRAALIAVAAVSVATAGVLQGATSAKVPPRKPKTHVVQMITQDGKQVFEPANLTIQQGDTVEWLAVSGSHNVAFWADSVPKGAPDLLRKAMPDTTAPLTSPRKPTKGDKYTMVFTGMPKGEYKYYCTPHLKKMMIGELTIQ